MVIGLCPAVFSNQFGICHFLDSSDPTPTTVELNKLCSKDMLMGARTGTVLHILAMADPCWKSRKNAGIGGAPLWRIFLVFYTELTIPAQSQFGGGPLLGMRGIPPSARSCILKISEPGRYCTPLPFPVLRQKYPSTTSPQELVCHAGCEALARLNARIHVILSWKPVVFSKQILEKQ